MSSEGSFAERMARLRAGDQDLATQLFNEYVHRLCGLARRRLTEITQKIVGPDEVVNSALASFFIRVGGGEINLREEEGLWDKLVEITLRKCGKWNKRFRARKRDARREVSIHAFADDSGPGREPRDDEPTPEEAATLGDNLTFLMRDLDAGQRRLAVLLLQGYKIAEIAAEVKLSERTVHRRLTEVRDRVRTQLDKLRALDGETQPHPVREGEPGFPKETDQEGLKERDQSR